MSRKVTKMSNDCQHNIDDNKLVREGASQDARIPAALDAGKPAYPLIDERLIQHRIVFARAYASYLRYYDANNVEEGDWQPFFENDVSVLLSVAAIQDVTYYRQKIKEHYGFILDRNNKANIAGLRNHLDYLFSCAASLAIALDRMKEYLPADIPLKNTLKILIRGHLAPSLVRLTEFRNKGLAYTSSWPVNKPDKEKTAVDVHEGNEVPFRIFDRDAVKFSDLSKANLSKDWTDGTAWASYYAGIGETGLEVFGSSAGVYDRIYHFTTHNLFSGAMDHFLKAYARVVLEASKDLERTFERKDHQPHFALFLAFLKLLEEGRNTINTLTRRHLDFYYRRILRLEEKPAEPNRVHLLAELNKNVNSREIKAGTLFKAGKDALGKDAYFANDRDFVINKAKVAALKTVYRHKNDAVKNTLDHQDGRLFASPVANSADGQGAELTSEDGSWHPFHNRIYKDGVISEIKMPPAEFGFAISSHYLLLAGGTRTITVEFTAASGLNGLTKPIDTGKIICKFTTAKGWLEKKAASFSKASSTLLSLKITLDGDDPAVTSYNVKKHGYTFSTDLPILIVTLRQDSESDYVYTSLQDVVITKVELTTDVSGLKSLAVSNDFGPVDPSKPFQPFGPSPRNKAALVIGSKEAFQKTLASATLSIYWQETPSPYTGTTVNAETEYLKSGKWNKYTTAVKQNLTTLKNSTSKLAEFQLLGTTGLDKGNVYVDEPDLDDQTNFNAATTRGFVRLLLDNDFGQSGYETALATYIANVINKITPNPKPSPPSGPFAVDIFVNYKTGKQPISLTSQDNFENRAVMFFHVLPFGQAEQHPYLKTVHDDQTAVPEKSIYLLPQLTHIDHEGARIKHEGEFYIGLTGLEPAQNLALLFQLADGTADPMLKKPESHIHWSYLRGNEWIYFKSNEVNDETGAFLNSGIVTLSVPSDASSDNTTLGTGMHWIRAAVASSSDAVCRLKLVAAQGFSATFTDKDNDPAFPTTVLPASTISKLDKPDAKIKQITQPFETFGGRGRETKTAFNTRVSERLRHKDRAIDLWDYERLVLEAFPQVYKARCLNHTQYTTNEDGSGIYRELAGGHVTLVVIANQRQQNFRDPLRPYVSLGMLTEIETFLKSRFSCFIVPHVKNPEFEEVEVVCKVNFTPGSDEAYSREQMNTAIMQFLSPWAFPGGGSPTFSGKVYKATLINFVEDLSYVNYVSDFQLFHSYVDLDGTPRRIEKEVIQGSKAVCVLVSARNHSITPINPVVTNVKGEKCSCQ